MVPDVKFDRYFWAKTDEEGNPGCPVWIHSELSAEIAKRLLNRMSTWRHLFPEGVESLIGIHDVGKISPGFQIKCSSWNGPIDGVDSRKSIWKGIDPSHTKWTEQIIRDYFYDKKGIKGKVGKNWAKCASAHHGKPSQLSERLIYEKEWQYECFKLIEYIEYRYGKLPDVKLSENNIRLITGMMTVVDWIASNELCFSNKKECILDEEKNKIDESLKLIGIGQSLRIRQGMKWGDLFPHCEMMRPIQKYMWECDKLGGVYVVEDFMGGGKTEAALALAYKLLEQGKARGIYFALPTQVTSNRIFFRVREFLKNCGVGVNEQSMQLAHGKSWLLRPKLYNGDNEEKFSVKDYDAQLSLRKWFSTAKRALLADFGVGTIDQALQSVVAVKHSDVRMFALMGKVVILDEVHSYDFYTGGLVLKLVELLRESGATVIILSATLTRERVRELLGVVEENVPSNYPCVSGKFADEVISMGFKGNERKEIKVTVVEQEIQDAVCLAYSRAQQGDCVLMIRNTVRDAQETYKLLKSEAVEGGPEIGLLHSRYPYWKREKLEERWLDVLGKEEYNRPNGCVLVATQVVEQSVDIDADFLITDLAPTDMLLQRAGRLWRHKRINRRCQRPEMHVVISPGLKEAVKNDDEIDFISKCGTSGKVYAPYVLLRSWMVWKDRSKLLFPEDIRTMIELTYEKRNAPSTLIEKNTSRQIEEKKRYLEKLVRLNTTNSFGVFNDEEGCLTRHGEIKTIEVILLKEKPELLRKGIWSYSLLDGTNVEINTNEWKYDVAKAISRNCIRIPKWMTKGLIPDKNLEKYDKKISSLFLLDDGFLCDLNEVDSPMKWDEYIGLEFIKFSKEKEEREDEFMY